MTNAASYIPYDASVTRIRAEADAALAIYVARYPGHRVRLVMREGGNPVWAEAAIVHGPIAAQPADTSAHFVGFLDGGSTSPDAPQVTVFLAIPRKPTPLEKSAPESDWSPRGRGLRLLYRLSPMIYERVRHAAERRAEARAGQHEWRQLPFGKGAAEFAPPMPATDKTPAVLIGVHWLDVGGAEKLALDCVEWARAAGLRVVVVAAVPGLHPFAAKVSEDVRFIRLDRFLPHAEWPAYLEQLVHEENIRLIHIHHCVPLYTSLAHLRMTTPWVGVMDSTHIVEYGDGGYPRISGVWSNYIDIHHVISNQLVQFYRSKFAVGQKAVLGRMLDTTASDLAPINMTVGKKRIEVTFIGRLYYQKRPITVILAMRAIAQWAASVGVTVHFNMVGEGPFAAACTKLARESGVADRLTTHPAGSDVPQILSNSDILLLPSANEGLALVCYEAIQHGAIPICTDVGAQHEIVPLDLLVPRDPGRACPETARIIGRLWSNKDFLTTQTAMLHERYRSIAADPTAAEVIGNIYRKFAHKA